jgi:hypothetical protein
MKSSLPGIPSPNFAIPSINQFTDTPLPNSNQPKVPESEFGFKSSSSTNPYPQDDQLVPLLWLPGANKIAYPFVKAWSNFKTAPLLSRSYVAIIFMRVYPSLAEKIFVEAQQAGITNPLVAVIQKYKKVSVVSISTDPTFQETKKALIVSFAYALLLDVDSCLDTALDLVLSSLPKIKFEFGL